MRITSLAFGREQAPNECEAFRSVETRIRRFPINPAGAFIYRRRRPLNAPSKPPRRQSLGGHHQRLGELALRDSGRIKRDV
jgi:hypothetical protein